MSQAVPDCTPKCRSPRHADEVMAALTGGSEGRLRAFLMAHCHNAATLRDAYGRTALHLAASLGKRALLEWLLENRGADLMVKDKESGWTALHRSVFYGHIHCLMALVKRGGLLSTQDKEGLSVLDLTMKDRPSHVVFRNADPTEVYTWGNNTNFSLGHGNQESRQHPEIVDVFARSGLYIKQVVLCKFHSVFLSQKGQVFTCGHGQGGRLGHGDEQTYLVPRVVEGLLSHLVSQVAAARDHTVVLTEEGYVYTFGLNSSHQLGLTPPPAASHLPKQVFSKTLKGRTVIGVAAGRFHTVLWTREAVYTMGLNGGQLGYLLDPNGEKCVTAPRQVSALHHKDVTIAMAAASNGATVVVTEKGDVYLLADYQCKKLASRQLNIRKVLVSGGSLDHRVDPQVLNESGGEKVLILALDQAGRVFCWRSSGSPVRQVRWAYGRQVFMSDMALSRSGMMFITPEGEGFSGQWLGEARKAGDRRDGAVEGCGQGDGGGAYERIRLEKLPYVYRAVSVTMDTKGRNFGMLQSDPKTSLYEIPSISPSSLTQHFQRLLEEADETDSIHDVTLQAGDRTFPAHKYILSMRSEFFRKHLLAERSSSGGGEEEADGEVRRSEDAVGCDLLVLEKVSAEMLEHALTFIYTDCCQMLVPGARPRVPPQGQNPELGQEQLISTLEELGLQDGLRGRSALDVYRSLPPSSRSDGDKAKGKGGKPGKKGKAGKATAPEGGANPVKTLQGVAKKLGIGSLSARLDGVKFEKGQISVVSKKTGNKPRFNPRKCSYLCDVTLRSEDGKEFPCHKCVLCARLEYFHSMLGNPWIEATSCSALDMATSSEILQVILEYVYTDESPTIKESLNVEFVCSVLVVADQLLINRLKEMCEVAITENLTLKNAAELLEFSAMYNAEQLKLSCLQFIVLNMAALLETRALDVLSDEVLLELSASYRRMIPAMQKRQITPYPDAPDLSVYEEEEPDTPFSPRGDAESEYSCRENLLKKAKMKAKRKPRRRSDSSGGYNLSDIIQSPPAATTPVTPPGLVKPGASSSMESLQEPLTSDSEGSYMGACSPRELQSPVGLQGTEDERAGIQRRRTPPSAPSTLKNGLPHTRSSAPEPIPRASSCSSAPEPIPRASSCSSAPEPIPRAPEPVSSLACTPPVLDLRAIMNMEAHSQTSLRGTPRSPALPNSSKPSPVPAKLSQKQRKIIAQASKEGSVEAAAPRTSPAPALTPPKSVKAWATTIQSPPSSRSFRDLLAEEEKAVHGRPGAPGRPVGLGGQTPAASAAKRVTFRSAAEPERSEPEKPAGPWVRAAAARSPPVGAMVTFASIVEEERQQEAALIRSREKALALIQIEERAIQDLQVHYSSRCNPEELIVVERSSQGPVATPTWNKH